MATTVWLPGHWCYTLRELRHVPGGLRDVCPICEVEFPPIGEEQPEPVWKEAFVKTFEDED